MADENILQCVRCLGDWKRDDRRCTACNDRGVMSLNVFSDLWASMHTNQIQQLDEIETQIHDIQASFNEHASSKPDPMSRRNVFGGDHE
jgi:predicted methyltransferase